MPFPNDYKEGDRVELSDPALPDKYNGLEGEVVGINRRDKMYIVLFDNIPANTPRSQHLSPSKLKPCT